MRGNVLVCKFCYKSWVNDYPNVQDNVVQSCPHCKHGGCLTGSAKFFSKEYLPYWDKTHEEKIRGYKNENWKPPYNFKSGKHLNYVYRIWRVIDLSGWDKIMNKKVEKGKKDRLELIKKARKKG